MTIDEHLDGLRAAIPGCTLAAYGDIGSQLVLRTASDTPWPREKLDELCRMAARQFSLARALGDESRSALGLQAAIVATSKDIRVIVAVPPPASDMLCCVCGAGVDSACVIQRTGAVLSGLVGRRT